MQDGTCKKLAGLTAAMILWLGVAQAQAQTNPPTPPDGYRRYHASDDTQYTSVHYDALLHRIEMLEASLDDKEKSGDKKEKEDPGYEEIDIQTKPSHKFRGRMFWDQLWMNDLSGAVPQALSNQTGFDTIRLGVTGNIYENLKYTAEFEFEGGEVDYKDVYGELQSLPLVGHTRIGFYKEPMGLEQLTSSRFITFMERSAPTAAFTPARNHGVMFYNYVRDNENLSWYAGLFRGGSADNDQDEDFDSNDWSFTARLAWLPYYDASTPGRCLLHVAGGYSTRRTGGRGGQGGNGDWEGFLELNSRDSLISIDLPAFDEFNVYNTELAYVRGPFSVQNEFFWSETGDTQGISSWGTYVTLSYFLTGENRGYKRSSKAFNRVKVYEPFFFVRTADGLQRGRGAWQIAARWSYLDLSDLAALNVGGVPGTQENLTFGLNWYLNSYSRMMFNYVHTISDYTLVGKSEGDHFGVRFQIDW